MSDDAERDRERKIEKVVAESLQSVSEQDIDLAELRLLLRRFDGIDVVLEAHRLAKWAQQKQETLTFPLRFFERWLEKARPMAERVSGKDGKPRLSEQGIRRRVENRKALMAKCVEWEGTRPQKNMKLVPMFTPEEIEADAIDFEKRLRERIAHAG